MSYDSRKLGYDQGGCARGGGVDLRLPRTTSSPSQTLRRRLVRTTDDERRRECSARRSTLAAVRRGFIFHTLRLVRLITLYAAKSDTRP